MWKDWTFVVLDIESTGLDVEKDRIVQIAAERIVNGQRSGSWSCYVDPGIPVCSEVVKIHGLTNDKLRALEARPFLENIPGLSNWLEGADAIVTYGRGDVPMLRAEYARCNFQFCTLPVIDVYVLIKEHDRHATGKRRFSLSGAAARWGVGLMEGEVAHDAITDVRMTTDLWIEVMQSGKMILPSDFEAFRFMLAQLGANQERQRLESKKK